VCQIKCCIAAVWDDGEERGEMRGWRCVENCSGGRRREEHGSKRRGSRGVFCICVFWIEWQRRNGVQGIVDDDERRLEGNMNGRSRRGHEERSWRIGQPSDWMREGSNLEASGDNVIAGVAGVLGWGGGRQRERLDQEAAEERDGDRFRGCDVYREQLRGSHGLLRSLKAQKSQGFVFFYRWGERGGKGRVGGKGERGTGEMGERERGGNVAR